MLPVLAIPVVVMGLIGSLLLGSMGVSNLQMEWYPVEVHFPAEGSVPADWHHDEIKGNGPDDALERAKWNWPEADQILLTETWEDVKYKHSILSIEGKDIEEIRRDYRWYATVLYKQVARNKAPKEYAQIEKIAKKIEEATTKEQFREIEKQIDKIDSKLRQEAD